MKNKKMKMEELFEWISTYSTQRNKCKPFSVLIRIAYFLHCDYAFKSQTMLTSDMDFEIGYDQIISKSAPKVMVYNLRDIDCTYDCCFEIPEKAYLGERLDYYLELEENDIKKIFEDTFAYRTWLEFKRPYKVLASDVMKDSIKK